MNKRTRDFLIPCSILAISVFLLTITNADIRIESLFYKKGIGWPHSRDDVWEFLYQYGPYPGLCMGGAAAFVLLASFIAARARKYRTIAVYLVLVLALGPGLITNVLKDYWGRPRPRQVDVLGGEKKFLQVWQPSSDRPGASFPSGHAAIAFYLFSPYLALRRTSCGWARFFLITGILYGCLMGLARMIQGGHFPSDILWSGSIVYISGVAVFYGLRMDKIKEPQRFA